MGVQLREPGQLQTVDAGFLARLTQRGVGDGRVVGFAVPTELNPFAHPRMQGQQYVVGAGVEDDRRRGQVTGRVSA